METERNYNDEETSGTNNFGSADAKNYGRESLDSQDESYSEDSESDVDTGGFESSDLETDSDFDSDDSLDDDDSATTDSDDDDDELTDDDDFTADDTDEESNQSRDERGNFTSL